ncbi:MAG: tRNA uridine-5-carboxymethylaminomethyl(34) synthesis enzyme MnmG [Calditrichaeota bacterium]|nr:MAG: tRNA uridine-5-carboxymethylaminomethyl(34) synthesis enzyme MnmG [Calditrichota bacterium]MBL1205460.1 tRNA uridine-5-carboxymethylaminomethyl(34) synthesis enzyme MnmG [Calditrichota bacterium]NOG45289.1 tRNA uridine-5-carboxymethylaminomethyl(34) synthesis enzyme MnmG [Calditrichota bacterium]
MIYDIAIVGGGHAGIEAAVICAKMGFDTALISLDKKKIGLMSCNPAIGGLAKGQLVREIDALGGAMGKIIDEAGIHFKMLNTSKGPAVQSPRAQADRDYYAQVAQNHISSFEKITVVEDMAIEIIIEENGHISGLKLLNDRLLQAKVVIITAGTFLNGLIHTGTHKLEAGRAGDLPAKGITESLQKIGFRSGRLKTGTPPRIHKDTIDYSKIENQKPDEVPQPFSFSTEKIERNQLSCFITYTNTETHEILKEGFDRSPLFTGRIQGVGPRYCPSIEDKIDRFSDKERHQLFLEPEGFENDEVYVNGFSSSLPGEIQERALKTVQGLENAKIIRLGYAVEYDFFPPDQLTNTLETKLVKNLYFAGQINGTSGYEEAAAQGLIAGINACLSLKKKPPFILKRSEAYIGVLIDDLINKIHEEPYRMFTSRAEFRLLLRHDNADLRLMDYAKKLGVLDSLTAKHLENRRQEIDEIKNKILPEKITPEVFNSGLEVKTSSISRSETIETLLKRPELKLQDLMALLKTKRQFHDNSISEVEYSVKYKGYLDRQQMLVDKFSKVEKKTIPSELNYLEIKSLSAEAREKLNRIKPKNLGQASRISGVRHADLSVLMIFIEKFKLENVSRETA